MHAAYPLVLGSLLFAVGVYGVLARRNAITVLMAIELLLNAVTINFVAFGSIIRDTYNIGQAFTLFVITIAAAETGLGLAIVLLIFREKGTSAIDEQRTLAEPSGRRHQPDSADTVPATGNGAATSAADMDTATQAGAAR